MNKENSMLNDNECSNKEYEVVQNSDDVDKKFKYLMNQYERRSDKHIKRWPRMHPGMGQAA